MGIVLLVLISNLFLVSLDYMREIAEEYDHFISSVSKLTWVRLLTFFIILPLSGSMLAYVFFRSIKLEDYIISVLFAILAQPVVSILEKLGHKIYKRGGEWATFYFLQINPVVAMLHFFTIFVLFVILRFAFPPLQNTNALFVSVLGGFYSLFIYITINELLGYNPFRHHS